MNKEIDRVKKVLKEELYYSGQYHKGLKPTIIIEGKVEEALTLALKYLDKYEALEKETDNLNADSGEETEGDRIFKQERDRKDKVIEQLQAESHEWKHEMAYFTEEDIPTPKGVARFVKLLIERVK